MSNVYALAPWLPQQFFDTNGEPLAGGMVYSYEAGTTTPQATYTDATGDTPNTNPIILDSTGSASIWMSGESYKFVITDSNNNVIKTIDDVTFATISLTTQVSGVLPVANGGTNSSTALNNNCVMISSGGNIVENSALTVSSPMRTNSSGLPTTGATNLNSSDVTGALPITNGGTGETTATAALNAILPSQSNGTVLTTNGTNAAFASLPGNSSFLKSPTFQSFLQTTYYTFTVSSSTFDAGNTYTNNSSTFTVVYASTVSGETTLVAYRSSGTNAPSSSGTLTYASGSPSGNITYSAVASNGTYFPTNSNVLWLRVRMVGGGGGGQGSASGALGGSGSNGVSTTFGSSLLSASNGLGADANTPVAGGSASVSSPAVGIAISGGYGGAGAETSSSNASFQGGACGGSSAFGGAGAGGGYEAAGTAGATNSGSGGGGGGSGNATTIVTGFGGSAGGFVDAIIASPSSSYVFVVGSGGAAGSAGTDGYAGGAGGSGAIFIEEHYQ